MDLAERIDVVCAPAPKEEALGLDLHATSLIEPSAIARHTSASAIGPEAGFAGREADGDRAVRHREGGGRWGNHGFPHPRGGVPWGP